MRIIDLLHRWTGGLIGLLLAVLGASGAVLVHRDAWVVLPHARDAQVQEVAAMAAAVTALTAAPEARPRSIVFATEGFGLHKLSYGENAGAYADQAGGIVARWDSKWERPEIWLFDLHHHLFAGDTGEIVAGIAALAGLGFVITGVILWWKYRGAFRLRAWPQTLSRTSIVRHHRDLGVVVAPVLTLSLLTGVMLTLEPVRLLLLTPWSSAEAMKAASARPKVEGGLLPARPDWARMLQTARARFPDAEFRTLSLPRKPGEPVSLRLRREAEWLPNGRTTLWFDPADGKLLTARDALTLPAGSRLFNAVYPLHAAKVGGLGYKLVMTASGLGLALLGTLSVWSFWFRRPKKRPRRVAATAPVEA